MSPGLAFPIGINLFALAGVILVASFTTMQILITAPLVRGGIFGAISENMESYGGIVAWVSKDSISIVDSMGVARTVAIDNDTDIYADESRSIEQKYSDIRQFDYVRVDAMRSAGLDRAVVILDIR